MNYKYVVAASTADFYVIPYSDLNFMEGVTYSADILGIKNKFVRFIYRIHFSRKINKIISLPFKSLWNRFYLKNDYDKDDNICFLITASNIRLTKYGLIKYLRKHYKNAKTVLSIQDMYDKSMKSYSLEELKNMFDLILSFDQGDCEKYGFTYYPLVYSCTEVKDNPTIKESDVYFVGKAKDRYDDIISAYKTFRDAGLVCDFNIVDSKKNQRKYDGEINYISQMKYETNLEHIKKTRCMLEVMQSGGRGYTLRYCEAIAHGRKLITNNPEIKNAPFYNEDLVSVFDKIEDIDTSFVKNGEREVDYHFKEKLSPKRLIKFVDERI